MKRLRVAAHVHSDWSYDGRWSLEQIASEFGRRGYNAVLVAEHDRGFDAGRCEAHRAACTAASTATCLLVAGIEYSDPRNAVHIPVWGEIPFLGEGLETDELLRRVDEAGGLAVLAHPARREAFKRIDPAWMCQLLGVELWNRKYDGYAPNRLAAELIANHPSLLPFVALDFHTPRQFHPLAMLVECDGPVSAREIFAAMRERRAQPTAFGLPALNLAHGAAWPAMYGLERVRRSVATRARRSEHLRRLRAGSDHG